MSSSSLPRDLIIRQTGVASEIETSLPLCTCWNLITVVANIAFFNQFRHRNRYQTLVHIKGRNHLWLLVNLSNFS